MKITYVFILFTIFFTSQAAIATDHVDVICTVDFAVKKDSELNSKRKAFLKAFQIVALRISSQTMVMEHKEILKPSIDIESLVNTYSYKSHAEDKIFSVTFNYNKTLAHLKNLGIDIPEQKNNNLIMWLLVKIKDADAKFLGNEATMHLKLVAEEVAVNYGVPLLLPLADLRDDLEISVNDVKGNSYNKIIGYSKERYAATNILIGEIIYNKNKWEADIHLLNESNAAWHILADDLEVLFATIYNNLAVSFFIKDDAGQDKTPIDDPAHTKPDENINQLLEQINAREKDNKSNLETQQLQQVSNIETVSQNTNQALALVELNDKDVVDVHNTDKRTVLVFVSGIDDLGKYASIMSYLRKIDGVYNVDVAELGEDSAIFAIETNKITNNLANIIERDKFLLPQGNRYVSVNEMRFILSS